MDASGVFEVKGKAGGLLYSDGNGYFYRCKEKRETRWRLICHNSSCKGSGTLFKPGDDDSYITYKTVHSCEPNQSLKEVNELRQRVLKRCREEDTAYSQIFHEETSNNDVTAEVSSMLNFAQLESTMAKMRRREGCPVVPQNINEFVALIASNTDKYDMVENQPFFSGVVGEGDDVAVIFLVQQLQHLLVQSDELHMDGTFKCVPKKPKLKQLFTIMALHQGIAFPVVYCLMARKTAHLYTSIFSHLKEKIPHLAPRRIISDFETGIKSAVSTSFPAAKHVGCWFHFSQCIYRKVQKLGLTCLFASNTTVNKIVHMIIALALLPHAKVEDGLASVETFFALQQEGLSPSDNQKVTSLLSYVRNHWMGKVGSKSFSVFGQTNRTNNCQESFHRRLNCLLGGIAHPNIWHLLGSLVKIGKQSFTDFLRVERNKPIRRNRKTKWLLQDKAIREAQDKISAVPPEMTAFSFLSSMAHRYSANPPTEVTDDEEDEDLVELQNDEEPDPVPAPVVEAADPHQENDPDANDLLERIEQQRSELMQIQIDSNDEPADSEFMSCLACCVNKRTYRLEPCDHFAICGRCCVLLREARQENPTFVTCLVCRVNVTGFKRTFF